MNPSMDPGHEPQQPILRRGRARHLANQPTRAQHENSRRQTQQLGQLARDQQHRGAPRRQIADQRMDLRLGADVDAARRLVEDQNLRAWPPATAPARPSAGFRPTARPRACRCSACARAAYENAHAPARAPPPGEPRSASRDARAAAATCSGSPLSDCTSPCRFRSSGTSPISRRIASRGPLILHLTSAHEDPARRRGLNAEHARRDVRPSGADEPRQSHDLAGAQRKRHVLETLVERQSFHAQHLVVRRRIAVPRQILGDRAPDHQLDELAFRELGGRLASRRGARRATR